MKTADVRLLQELLNEAGLAAGAVDGLRGPRTNAAVRAGLKAIGLASSGLELPTGWGDWSARRQAVLYLQFRCAEAALPVGPLDGLWGPQTEYATEQLAHLREHGEPEPPWRDAVEAAASGSAWPREAELETTFGPPGEHLVMLELPYPLRLSWDLRTSVTRTQCHVRVRDSLRSILEAVLAHYGLDGIRELRLDRYGGGYNHRNKRGGSRLSTHAWGIAFDFDPARNRLRWGRDRAAFAGVAYETWWRCWEREGWISLGRARNFDWMHVQAARLD